MFTATPKVSTASQAMSQAMQCWSEIATWRNSSASFWNAKIADRTWAITSSWSSTSLNWTRTSTIYPSSVSTYSLCDGTPRVDVRPATTTITGASTLWDSMTETLTPTFAAQPCSLRPKDCRILFQDTNIKSIDDRELLRQCGNPAHVDGDAECLLGGGPVEIIYFPVTRDDQKICQSDNSTMSAAPLIPGLSEISTLGHTFESASVYISFKTLFATYDGFWDTVGPTFTDYIVPLHSTDISTQCGGWHAAYGHGTALNYGDLNWPVPASAYKCQERCAEKLASSAYITKGTMYWSMYIAPTAPECSTIWSDVNPVVALPTKIKDMVPEWSTCSFYNDNLANFWFDPPIALQPQAAVAKPTLPTTFTAQSTSALPASTPDSPLPENTQVASTRSTQNIVPVTSTAASETSSSSTTTAVPETIPSEQPLLFTPVDSSAETGASSSAIVPTIVPTDIITDASTDDSPLPSSIVVSSSNDGVSQPASFIFDPIESHASIVDVSAGVQSSMRPEVATAAGFSILTQALSSFKNAGSLASTATQEIRSTSTISVAVSTSTSSGLVIPIAGTKVTLIQTNDHIILGSSTFSQGDVFDVAGSTISFNTAGLIVGESTYTVSALPKPTATRTAYVIASRSFTLSASTIEGNAGAVQVGSATLSVGGPAATVSEQVLTKASSGVLLLPNTMESSEGEELPSVIDQKPAQTAILAAGGHTVTAVILTGDHTAISVGGTTLSLGGDAAVMQNATFTVGPGGLGVVRSRTSSVGMNSTTTLPTVLVTSSSSSTRSRWSSSASIAPTSTSDGRRVERGLAGVLLVAGSLLFLLYI